MEFSGDELSPPLRAAPWSTQQGAASIDFMEWWLLSRSRVPEWAVACRLVAMLSANHSALSMAVRKASCCDMSSSLRGFQLGWEMPRCDADDANQPMLLHHLRGGPSMSRLHC